MLAVGGGRGSASLHEGFLDFLGQLVKEGLVRRHAAEVHGADVYAGQVLGHFIHLGRANATGKAQCALCHAGLDVGVVGGEGAFHGCGAGVAHPVGGGARCVNFLVLQGGHVGDREVGIHVVAVGDQR